MKKLIFTVCTVLILNSVSWTQSTCVTPVRISQVGNQAVYELRLTGVTSPQVIDTYSGFLDVTNGNIDAATFTSAGGTGGGSFSGNRLTFNLTDPNPNPTVTILPAGGFLIGTVTITSVGVPVFTLLIFEVYLSGSVLDNTSVCDIVLPVELLSFNAQKSGKQAIVKWESLNEKNLSAYVIERSENGLNFKPIATETPKAPNNEGKMTYSFVDENPATGINYYRLQSKGATKEDFKFSKIVSIDFGSGLTAKTFPNPFATNFYLEIDIEQGVKGEIIVNIFDTAGKQVWAKKITAEGRKLNFDVPTDELAAGSYVIRIINGANIWQQKIAKLQ
jgi:hypothetical protein